MGEQDVGDLEVIRKNVEGWLQQALPSRPGLRIADLDFPKTSGESSVTLILEAQWQDGGEGRFVLRMVPPQSQVFENHDLLMQYQIMEVMRREGVPVPSLVGYEPDGSLLGSDFYVMNFEAGEIPPDNPPMVFAGWVKELDADQRSRMWSSGLETLAAIHRIEPDRHDLARLPRSEDGEPLVAQQLRMYESLFRPETRASCDSRISEAWDFVVAHPPVGRTRRICWGDSRVGNVIFRDLAPVAVIDWELANLGDPLSDLAWWIWIDRCNSIGLGAEKLPGVPDGADVYARWHELTGLPIDDIAYYELFAVTRYAIILERKFEALRATHSEMGAVPNFTAQFLPELVEAARAR